MKFLEDLVSQVEKWPMSLALVIAMSCVGIALKRMEAFPNKFIPAVLMLCSTVLYALIGQEGSINPDVRYPSIRLGIYGLILGMVSWLSMGLIWRYVIDKVPGAKGDTALLGKPKE